jgi:hypothetical protein
VSSLNYFGDLVPRNTAASFDLSFTRPSLGAEWRYRFHQNMFFRGSFMWGRIRGSDSDSADPNDPKDEGAKFRHARNLNFRNDIKELSAIVSFDLFSNYGTFLNRQRFTPYVFAGVAAFHHNPRGLAPDTDRDGNPLPEAGQWVELRPLGTEGQYDDTYYPDVKPYSNFQVAFPGGIGIRWLLDKRWDLEAELTYRYLITDYIDDVSGDFVDLGVLDGQLAKTMADRSMDSPNPVTGIISYTGVDGQTYTTRAGYGHDPTLNPGYTGGANVRGLEGSDGMLAFSVRIVYILTGSFQRAKFR